MTEENLDGQIELAGSRVFKERGRNTSARWFILNDGRTFHSRCGGHLAASMWSAEEIARAVGDLEEITE